MFTRFRRDPAFTDAGPPEPPAELLILRANRDAALAEIDRIIVGERSDPTCDEYAVDLLLEVRQKLAPGNRVLSSSVPVVPGGDS